MIQSIIDISHWEDPIDFKKVSAGGIVAVIAKATHGAAGVDSDYAKYKNAAAPYKFLWGSYHFGTGSEVSVQVEHYLSVVKPSDRELVCLDFETNPSGPTMTLHQACEFVALFQHLSGRYPVLYGRYWLKASLNNKPDDVLAKCPLWLAQYGPRAVLPVGWKEYALWQFTDGNDGPPPHNVFGIGPCDRNQFNGTEATLRKRWPFS
jgi:lysozyme